MGSVDLLLREAEAHEYFAENADLRMTTCDHAKRAANIRAIAAALREQPEARGVVDGAMVERAARAIAEVNGVRPDNWRYYEADANVALTAALTGERHG